MIAATADFHYPTYSDLLWAALQKVKKPDLLLLAGDLCEAFHPGQYRAVLKLLERKKLICPTIACWGNTEFERDYDKIRQICGKKIIFLTDETLMLDIHGRSVGIVGTKGSLDRPTTWQLRNIPDIREVYAKRVELIARQLTALSTMRADIRILLVHYSPTYESLKGESPSIYAYLGCRRLEGVIRKSKPTFVIHAHSHKGLPLVHVDAIPIFNVSLPLNKRIIEIDPDKLPKPGLRAYV